MKLFSEIVCIDLETTDLQSDVGEVIQLGAIKLSQEFTILDTFDCIIKPATSHRSLASMRINEITEEELAAGFPLNTALEMFEVFCGNQKILGAWGTYFDIEFQKKQYSKIYRDWPFHWRSIDLKSIAIWEFAKRDVEFSGGVTKGLKNLGLDIEGSVHNAKDDIINATRILQKFLKEDNIMRNTKKGW